MTPVTRQCCGVSAVAATTRAVTDRRSGALNPDRLSHPFAGTVSATAYFASELLALAKACADACDTDTYSVQTTTSSGTARRMITVSFDSPGATPSASSGVSLRTRPGGAQGTFVRLDRVTALMGTRSMATPNVEKAATAADTTAA